jgi:hypothetical protein
MEIPKDERLYMDIVCSSDENYLLDKYWRNSTYPSRISYEGRAIFIPEFQRILFVPLFMMTTLLAIIVFKRRPETFPK